MREASEQLAVVVEADQPVGVITAADVLRRILPGAGGTPPSAPATV